MSRDSDPATKLSQSETVGDLSEHDLPPELLAKRRVRYLDDEDPEAQLNYPSRTLTRRRSSMSIHSMQSARRVDPVASLPTAYRTVSFNITNTQERAVFEAKQKKASAEQSE